MSAGHHVPSSGVPGRATKMDTPTGTALGSTRRDETADANDIVRAVKFTINNLPCSRRGTLAFAHRVGKRAQSTSFHPLCIIYYFLDLINKTPAELMTTFMSTGDGPATKLSRPARARPCRISRNRAESAKPLTRGRGLAFGTKVATAESCVHSPRRRIPPQADAPREGAGARRRAAHAGSGAENFSQARSGAFENGPLRGGDGPPVRLRAQLRP